MADGDESVSGNEGLRIPPPELHWAQDTREAKER